MIPNLFIFFPVQKREEKRRSSFLLGAARSTSLGPIPKSLKRSPMHRQLHLHLMEEGDPCHLSEVKAPLVLQFPLKKSSLKPLHWVKVTRAMQGSLWADSQKQEIQSKALKLILQNLRVFSWWLLLQKVLISAAMRINNVDVIMVYPESWCSKCTLLLVWNNSIMSLDSMLLLKSLPLSHHSHAVRCPSCNRHSIYRGKRFDSCSAIAWGASIHKGR